MDTQPNTAPARTTERLYDEAQLLVSGIDRVETGMSLENIAGWTVADAIAELLQNALDVAKIPAAPDQPPYTYTITHNPDTGTLTIADDGPGIQRRHLAFGLSDKPADASGQFGHGLKQALIVLANNDIPCRIDTPPFSLTAAIETGALQTPCLTLYFDSASPHRTERGTTVTTTCSPADYDNARRRFPALDPDRRYMDDAHTISTPAGSLFVNGVHVYSFASSLYSYHLTGDAPRAIVTDKRRIIDTSLAYRLLGPILRDAPQSVCEVVLKELTNPSTTVVESFINYPTYGVDPATITQWASAFATVFGPSAILNDSYDASPDRLKYLGFAPVKLHQYSLQCMLAHAVTTSKAAASRYANTAPTPVALTRSQTATWKKATNYLRYKHFNLDACDVVFCAEISTITAIAPTGLYSRKDATIYITTSQLDAGWTVAARTYLHELAHHISSAPDCSAEFEQTLCDFLAQLMA